MKEITHVIYDVDGLLLDTEPFYTEVHQLIAARYGKVFDWSLKAKTIGLRAMDTATVIVTALELPMTPEEYLRTRKPLLEELFPDAQPMPGARRLTEHLHRHGVPQAVATSSDRRNFEIKTSRHREWFGIFESTVAGDDPEVKRGKPAPDIFLIAARQMGAAPARCLVLEDAPSGVAAARAGGMSVIAVPDPNMSPAAYPGADQVLRSLEEFDPGSWGLPSY
jgi:pseudouridine 5'-phosphatase